MLPDEYNHIDRYQRYLAELYAGDPSLANCAGATEADIAELQRVANRELPQLYLGYLRHFGSDDGPINLCDDCQSAAEVVLRYLRRSAKKEYPVLPPDCVMIGIRALSFARCLWYEDEGVEPKVVVNDWEQIVETLADSFGTYLYRQTWRHRYFLNSSIYMYGSKDMSFDHVAAAIEPMGFSPTFFSDEHYFTAERGEVKLISRAEKDRVRVTLAGEDEWQTGDVAGRISEALGLVER